MDDDHRELVQRLFAAATALMETAHEAAVTGQSGEIGAADYAAASRRLQATARDVAILAEAATIVANMDPNQGHNTQNRHR